MRDWLGAAQRAAEEHISEVWNFWQEGLDDQLPEDAEDPSYGPFCGCTTCEVREVLHAAVPIIVQGIIAGDLQLQDLVDVAPQAPQPSLLDPLA